MSKERKTTQPSGGRKTGTTKKASPSTKSASAKKTTPSQAKKTPGKTAGKPPAARSSKKTAPPKNPGKGAQSTPAPKPSQPHKPTAVVARIDVGFGNHLFIRGEGPGMSWDRGLPMDCTGDDRWQWTTLAATQPFKCKLLINDQHWALGEDTEVSPGERVEVHPQF